MSIYSLITPVEFINLIYNHVDNPEITINRHIEISAPAESVFHLVERIGGDNGWYTFNWMLKLRGMMSGKFKPYQREYKILTVGDDVDFFKVADIEKDKYLLLKFNDNRLDGVFGFYLEKRGVQKTMLYACTYFGFKNSSGKLYWRFVNPFDKFLQKRMLSNIKRLSENMI